MVRKVKRERDSTARMAKTSKLTMLVVDDHRAVRVRLKLLLEEAFPGALVRQAKDVRQLMKLTRSQPWDVVLLDISLPDRSGLDVLPEIKREHPETRVLIVSNHPEEQYGAASLRAGASGYVTKGKAPEQLADAIRTVLSGRTYFAPAGH
jgi:two-component system invasion response regulator UvrY